MLSPGAHVKKARKASTTLENVAETWTNRKLLTRFGEFLIDSRAKSEYVYAEKPRM
jgi:hypothetical protein